MSTRPELTDLPGIPEAVLAQALVAALPAHGAPAPWECRCTGLVWLGRGGHAARTALPPALRGRRPLATLGGLVRYQHTPVGQYDEVFGLVASRTGPRDTPRSSAIARRCESPSHVAVTETAPAARSCGDASTGRNRTAKSSGVRRRSRPACATRAARHSRTAASRPRC